MTEQEVTDLIGKENWDAFILWMRGQTIGISDDGVINYYSHDVHQFKGHLERKK